MDPADQPTPPQSPPPKRFVRSRTDRMLGGIAGGLGAYFGIDALLVRLAIVVLVVVSGGGGLLAYGVVWLFSPADGADGPPVRLHGRSLLVRLVVLTALLGASALVFAAGVWAVAVGGGVTLALVITVVGAGVAAAAFVRPVRWLAIPAVALALGAAFAAAAGIDGKGGVGARDYHPASAADLRDHYQLGAGRLLVDLRDARLTGEHRVRLDVGIGEAVLLVPEDVCVSASARLGIGGIDAFQRSQGGIDVDWQDRRTATAGRAHVVVDADIGIGHLQIGHEDADIGRDGDFGRLGGRLGRNVACA